MRQKNHQNFNIPGIPFAKAKWPCFCSDWLKEEAVPGFLTAAGMLAMLVGARQAAAGTPVAFVLPFHVPSMPGLWVTAVPSRREEQGPEAGTSALLSLVLSRIYTIQDMGWDCALPYKIWCKIGKSPGWPIALLCAELTWITSALDPSFR